MEDSCIKSRDGPVDGFDIPDFNFNDDSGNTLYVPPCTGTLYKE